MAVPSSYSWTVSSINVHTLANPGVVVTPGNNTKGSWVDLLDHSLVTQDVFAMRVNVNSNAVAAQNRSLLVDVGIKPNGGAYSVLVPDLNCSRAPAGNSYAAAGLDWDLPIRVPAGHTIGVRSSVNNATVGTHRAWVEVMGLPTLPHSLVSGSYCETLGTNAASSCGTDVTAFDNQFGVLTGYGTLYTTIGTTTKDLHTWIMALGRNSDTDVDTAVGANLYYGNGSIKVPLIVNTRWSANGSSQVLRLSRGTQMSRFVPAGSVIYAQIVAPVTLTVPFNVSAYGIGGT